MIWGSFYLTLNLLADGKSMKHFLSLFPQHKILTVFFFFFFWGGGGGGGGGRGRIPRFHAMPLILLYSSVHYDP